MSSTPNSSDNEIPDSKSETCDLPDAKPCSSQAENGSIDAEKDDDNCSEEITEEVETEKATIANNVDDGGDASTITHPYVGKEVKIQSGPAAGKTTKILAVATRGWWKLADVDGAIHSRRCVLLDKVPEQEMVDWYESRGIKYHPSRARFQKIVSQVKEDDSEQDVAILEDNSANETPKGTENSKRKRKFPVEDPFCMSDLLNSASSPPINRVYCEHSHQKLKYGDSSKLSILPPVLLDLDEDQTPSALKHLAPSQMIDIFDRKTGKIKSGNDGIAVKDLPRILRHHAEYEPIVPNSSSREPYSLELPRQCRSSAYAQVSAKVLPQKPLQLGSNENKDAYLAKICNSTDMENGRKTVEDGGHKTNISETDENSINSVFKAALGLTMRAEVDEANKKRQDLRELKIRLNKFANMKMDKQKADKYQEDAKRISLQELQLRKQRKISQMAHDGIAVFLSGKI